MVTVAEALQRTEEAETSALEREKQISQAESRARKIRVGGTVAEQFRFGTGLKSARRESKRQREKALSDIEKAREELGTFRGQIAERRTQIKSIQEQRLAEERRVSSFNRDLTIAKKFVNRDRFPFGESKRIKELFRKIKEGRNIREKRAEQIQLFREEGLDPIFVGGQLRGFGSEELDISFQLQDLPDIQPGSISRLEEAGLITVERVPEQLFTPLQSIVSLPQGDPKTFIERVVEKGGFVPTKTLGITTGFSGADLALATIAVGGEEVQKVLRAPGFGKAALGFPTLKDITPIGKIEREAKERFIGFTGRATSFLVPTTKEQVAVQVGLAVIPLALPTSVLKFGVGAFAFGTGVSAGAELSRSFVQPELTLEEITAIEPLTVTKFEPPTGLKGQAFKAREFIETSQTKAFQGKELTFEERAKVFAVSAAIPLIELPGAIASLGKGLVTKPIETVASIPSSLGRAVGQIGGQLLGPTPGAGFGRIAGELAIFKGIGKVSKVAFKPVILKVDPPSTPAFTSKTTILNIRRGGVPTDIGSFSVTGIQAPRRAFVTSGISEVKRGAFGLKPPKLSQLSFEELRLVQPSGKIIELQPSSVAVSLVEPFFLKGGKITKPVRKGGLTVEVQTIKATPSRLEPKIISRLEGQIRPGDLSLRSLVPSKLDPLTRKSFQELQRVRGTPKGIDIRFDFPKESKLQTGGIIVKDISKLVGKEFKILPRGRRTKRGEITAIQKQTSLTQFEGREFGLREFETLSERIGVVDVSFPRALRARKTGRGIFEKIDGGISLKELESFSLVTPRKVDIIRGKVDRFQFELPVTDIAPPVFQRGVRPRRTKGQQQILSQSLNIKAIQASIGSIAKLQRGLLSGRAKPISQVISEQQRIARLPRIVGGGGLTQSQFVGTGMFERTAGGLLPSSFAQTDLTRGLGRVKTGLVIRGLDSQILIGGLVTKLSPREITKTLTKDITKEITKLSPRLAPRLTSKLFQKQATKQVTKLVTKLVTKFPGPPGRSFSGFGLPSIGAFRTIPPLLRDSKRKKIKKIKKRRIPRTPIGVSFTASALGITGKFPTVKVKGLGLLPTQLRVIPVSRRRRTSRKKRK